jgi:hypothetical protein
MWVMGKKDGVYFGRSNPPVKTLSAFKFPENLDLRVFRVREKESEIRFSKFKL